MMKNVLINLLSVSALFWMGCASDAGNDNQADQARSENPHDMEKYAKDPHSFADPNAVATTHLSLELDVDPGARSLHGTATYDLERNDGDELILDIRDLTITRTYDHESGEDLEFEIVEGNDAGDALKITLHEGTSKVSVDYSASPNAAAILWMDPAQTNGGTAPFMFTQGQAILTRSWIPIQDTPSIRVTYDATVRVPEGMLALMSAENPVEKNDSHEYTFTMSQPIPPYLMALAVGDIAFRSLGDQTGVYAEPGILEEAAYELADTQNMLEAAEGLYGAYEWERYDVLFLPPGFPFGGMENPRLTFATPTIIAGDRSLTALVAHELAHSWSGNLVTNATWNDFWLNEGFTVYFENRIMEELYGSDYADMLKVLGYQDLQRTIGELGPESRDTHLYLDLDGRNPDDGMTDVAYEKGSLFLRWLEAKVGRERFDQFLRTYFKTHAFQTMTTEKFVEYLDAHLLNELDERPDVEAWIYGPALPEGHPVPKSTRFEAVQAILDAENVGNTDGPTFDTGDWSTHEWLYFIRGLPDDIGVDRMRNLDAKFGLTESENSEIAAAWFELAIRNDYRPAFDSLREFLIRVGRRKFLKPLYEELASTADHKDWAKEVYEEARPHYHIVSVETVDHILDWEG